MSSGWHDFADRAEYIESIPHNAALRYRVDIEGLENGMLHAAQIVRPVLVSNEEGGIGPLLHNSSSNLFGGELCPDGKFFQFLPSDKGRYCRHAR